MTMRIGERLTVLMIILVTASFCYAVLSTLGSYQRPVVQQSEPWTPPKIQSCDLELWERIRGNCP